MIRVDAISKSYAGTALFENISFSIGTFEKIALIGRNGSGKTTLLRILAGEEFPDSGSLFRPPHYQVGVLSQHASFQQSTVLEEAMISIKREDHDDSVEENFSWKAKKMLSGLGFSLAQFDARPSTLSGGFTLRLQLIKLLLSEPDLLLLDEPTNYLDIPSIRWLIQFLSMWKKELITISHDKAFLDAISTHTMGLHREKLMKIQGKTANYFHIILEQERLYTKAIQKREEEREKLERFITRFGAKATKAGQAQSKKKQLDRLPELEELSRLQSLAFRFQEAPTHAKCILEAVSISFSYPENSPLFSNVGFSISPKSRLAIAGKNGAGKSTLLKVLRGELPPSCGKVILHPSCQIGYFGQTNIDRLEKSNTIEEEIAHINPNLTVEQIKSLMGVMMFPAHFHRKKISVLSGGEKSRVLLAKILATPTNLLLLDEPTNHLDVESIESLCTALEQFSGAVVIVSHSEELLSRLSDSCLIFDAKKATYYPMGYELFCSEIGWNEEVITQENREGKDEGKDGSRDRRARAIQVQERARATKPVKIKIQKIEEQITALESKKAAEETSLINLIQVPGYDSSKMVLFQKNIHSLSEEIEKFYEALEAADIELKKIEKQ